MPTLYDVLHIFHINMSECRNKEENKYQKHRGTEHMNINEFLLKHDNVWVKLRFLKKIITNGEWECSIAVNVLGEFLSYQECEVVTESLSLLSAIMPVFGKRADTPANTFFSKVIECLGSINVQVKVGAIRCLYAYINALDNIKGFMKIIINYGLENDSESIRCGCLLFVNTFASTLKISNATFLINSIMNSFNQKSKTLCYYSFFTLVNFHKIFGHEFLAHLTTNQQIYQSYMESINLLTIPQMAAINENTVTVQTLIKISGFLSSNIPKEITNINEMVRCNGVRKIRSRFRSPNWNIDTEFRPHLEALFMFLSKIFDDPVVKIKLLTLDIVAEIIERIACEVILHLSIVLKIIFKTSICRQQLIKTQGIQIFQRIMNYVHPMAVIGELLKNGHQSSIMTADIIIKITNALLTFPSYCFEIDTLFYEIGPFLDDFVPNVRQAALECYVMLSYISIRMGRNVVDITQDLTRNYGVQKEIANLILKRAKRLSFPFCGRNHVFPSALGNTFMQYSDSTMDDMSNDSIATLNYSESSLLSDKGNESKKESIFQIQNVAKNDQFSPIQSNLDVCSGDHLHSRTSNQTYSGNSSRNEVINSFEEKTPHTPSASSNEFIQKSHISVFENERSFSKMSDQMQDEALKSNHFTYKDEQNLDRIEKKYQNNGLQTSTQRNTSTPEVNSEEFQPCFSNEGCEISAIATDDYVEEEYENRDKLHSNDGILVSSSDGTHSSVLNEGSLKSTLLDHSCSYTSDEQEDQSSCNDLYDCDTTLTEDKADDYLTEEMSTNDKHELKSLENHSNRALTGTKTDTVVEGEEDSSVTEELLPSSSKNFNIFVLDDEDECSIKSDSKYIEEVFDNNCETIKDNNSAHIIIEFPETPSNSTGKICETVCDFASNEIFENETNMKVACQNTINSELTAVLDTINKSSEYGITFSDTTYENKQSRVGNNYQRNQPKKMKNDKLYSESDTILNTTHKTIEAKENGRRTFVYFTDKEQNVAPNYSKKHEIHKISSVCKSYVKYCDTQSHKDVLPNSNSYNGFDNDIELENFDNIEDRLNTTVGSHLCGEKTNRFVKSVDINLSINSSSCVIEKPKHVRSKTLIIKKSKDVNKNKKNEFSEVNNKNVDTKQFERNKNVTKFYDKRLPGHAKYINQLKKPDNISVREVSHDKGNSGQQTHKNNSLHGLKNKSNPCKGRELLDEDISIHSKINKTQIIHKKYPSYDMLNETFNQDSLISTKSDIKIPDEDEEIESDNENMYYIENNDNSIADGDMQLQLKSKATKSRSAFLPRNQSIEFSRRSQYCSWSGTFETKIESQKPFVPTEHDAEGIKQALEDLQEDNILKCEEAMLNLIRYARFNSQLLSDIQVNDILNIIISLMKSLKTSIAGEAVLTIGYLFMYLKRPLESKTRIVVRVLLQKSGNRTFAGLYNAVLKSLFYLIHGITPYRALQAFIDEGVKHQNKVVRETAAQFILFLIKKLGHDKCLVPVYNKMVINTAAIFTTDGLPLTRYCGKVIFSILMENPNFEILKKKLLSEKLQRTISKALTKLSNGDIKRELLPLDLILEQLKKTSFPFVLVDF